MTKDERDPVLQSLFADTRHEFPADEFVARVMARSRFIRYRTLVPWVILALALAAGAWFLAIPIEVAQLFAEALTTTLIDLGDSWLAWLFSPINNIAALFVLAVKAIRMGRRKIVGAAYANW
jgi:bacteriorhodopsin